MSGRPAAAGPIALGGEEMAAAQLRTLKKLKDQGLISMQEYEQRKKPLLEILIVGKDEAAAAEQRAMEQRAAMGGGAVGPQPAIPVAAQPYQPVAAQPYQVIRAAPLAPAPLVPAAPAANRSPYAHSDGFDLAGAEKAVRHEYDPRAKKWTRTAFLCRIEGKPFAEGAMRTAHRLFDLAATGPGSLFVVKISKDPRDAAQQYFDDVEMQMEARMWAQRYNERLPPKSVDFIAAYVLELVDRAEKPLCGVEKFISGTYRKWNNNWDWSDEERNTPQAFSHFTWEASGNRLLICDLQGVGDLWTDPQIHTSDRQGYGRGNMGMDGIMKFLNAHRCNAICQYLNLPPTNARQVRQGGKRTVVAAQRGPNPGDRKSVV